MYARFRTRSKFYKRPERPLRAYNVSPNTLRRPKVKPGLLRGVHSDETVDLRDRERLELLESIRHPRERDFYQDHTYHNQWIRRDLEQHQKMQLSARYRYFAPDYVITPWIWYPGDVVEVVSGEGVGQRGAIIAVAKYKNEIIVQNINVQDVVIPASETRPEQVVQREHPISVGRVRHVDPSTNELCNLDVVRVRNKETGALEEKRMSLESGVLLPIPPLDSSMEVGDPLKDTPIQDADEATYDREAEMAVLVQRRLHAMEDYFVRSLRDSYNFHEPLRAKNAEDMRAFQSGVVDAASTALAEKLLAVDGTALPAWWKDAIAPHVEGIKAEMLAAAEEEEEAAKAATAADGETLERAMEQEDGFIEDGEEEEGESDMET
ncbi:putative delta-1-pyrroline-5-carboxylate dehydrogenase [Trypanosoma conorhini]|uniref:Putative delta-1-pyrroline-5-carboxylate dehydrogenase n=1 Tax=Trypanosoma conorhini TaxID=83891 RepID=A0A422MY27_9TRYP|nr:putative delta-1-pyrroline-5-carboxylate dehydrogenase [Trypanosoma conorhini]RNE98138.1 putative delta-1-pyrroline-5-carboxylate dehydrogenase [Trypanosoma conorhini]